MDLSLSTTGYVQGLSAREAGGVLLSNSPQELMSSPAADNSHANSQVPATRAVKSNQLGFVISKIEDIFESITDCILDEKKELVIHLKSRSRSKPRQEEGEEENDKRTKVVFPSKNAKEAWKFSKSRLAVWHGLPK